jgi:hypothetical protein
MNSGPEFLLKHDRDLAGKQTPASPSPPGSPAARELLSKPPQFAIQPGGSVAVIKREMAKLYVFLARVER